MSMGLSNTVQSYTTQPIMWTMTLPDRSREENLRALGYGLWKSFELYVSINVPVSLGRTEDEAILGRLERSSLPAFEGNQIIRKTISDGVKIIVAQTPDDLMYLKKMNAKAAYMAGEGTTGSILIKTDATRSHILEEAIHHQQRMLYGNKFVDANKYEMEIQAQNTLLEIGRKENWSKDEMTEIKKAKNYWEIQEKKK